MTRISLSVLAVATALSGCMTVAEDGGGGGGGGGGDPFTPAVRTSEDLTGILARADTVSGYAATNTPSFLPAGNISYNGRAIATDVSIQGQSGYQMVGDLNLQVNFPSSGSVFMDGSIRNIDLFEGSTPLERLSGELDVGTIFRRSGRSMDGSAEGELTGVFDNGTSGTVDMTWGLDGDLRRISGNNSYAFYGDNTDGAGTGVVDITINDGEFYATR